MELEGCNGFQGKPKGKPHFGLKTVFRLFVFVLELESAFRMVFQGNPNEKPTGGVGGLNKDAHFNTQLFFDLWFLMFLRCFKGLTSPLFGTSPSMHASLPARQLKCDRKSVWSEVDGAL